MKQVLKKYSKSFALIAFIILICNIFGTIHPYIMKKILDLDFSVENITEILITLIICYVFIHFIHVFLENLRNVKVNKVVTKVLKEIRAKLFDKVLKLKMSAFEKYSSSDIYARLTLDVENLSTFFYNALNIVINNILYIILMCVMMFFADVNLALVGVATIVLVGMAAFKSTRTLGKIDNELLKKRDIENKEFSEIYNKNKLSYLFDLKKDNINKTDELFDSEMNIRRKYIHTHTFVWWIIVLVEAIGVYCILYYALNINLGISLGAIYLVLYYTKQCKAPLEQIFDELEEIQTCMNSYKRIKVLLNEKDEEIIEKGEYVDDLDGDIEFENVSMKYNKEEVLKNISFIIKKGNKVTIAGRTGAGKTTITNALMKLYDIDKGRILINNYDISKVSTKCLRDNISYISQNPYIFEDTARNNITLEDPNITDKQIEQLIIGMGVESVFAKLENGLDTKIDLSRLSYGELQVIAFIRAILHKANIYIFDEPTSNIDLKTEKMIQNIIEKISRTSTVIIIAHRKSTIASSDKVIYLKDGTIDTIINKDKLAVELAIGDGVF